VRRVKTGKSFCGLLAGLGLMLLLRGPLAQAQQAEQPQSPPEALPAPSQPPPRQKFQAQPEPGETELLHLLVGQRLEVSSPSPIKSFSVSSPGFIDAALENSNQIQIEGKVPGGVSLTVQDENGQTQIFYVYVEPTDTSLAAPLPEAPPDNPVPAQVQKIKTAWLGWVVIAPVVLLAGALFKVLRKREPYGLDLRSPKLVPLDSCSEPALSPPEIAHLEEDPPAETVVQAATTQAEGLERVSQELAEQWWRQCRTEAEAALAELREEIKNLGKGLEESEQRRACLAEAKMASLWEATQEEYSMQIALALQEHAHEMREATAAEMESVKKAAGDAVAQLEAAEEKSETSLAARTAEAEQRLAGVSAALEAVEGRLQALVQGFEWRIESSLQAVQGKVEKQAEDLEKLVQDLGGRWTGQFQKQAEATLEKLREEANQARRVAEESQRQSASMSEANLACLNQAMANATAGLETEQKKWVEESQRQSASKFEANLACVNQAVANAAAGLEAEQKKWVEESQRQLSRAVEAKVESLSQFAVSISASLQAEHKQLKNEYETSRREFENLVSRRPPAAFSPPPRHENRRNWRGIVPRLAMVTGILLAITVPVLAVYLWPAPAMQLRAQPPAEFIDDSPNWGPARRGREQEMAQAYWQLALASLQQKYPFGSELPAEPPSEFDASKKYLPAVGAKALSETRDHYWQKLRKVWVQRDSWVETSGWDAPWSSRLKHLWGQAH